MRRLITPLALIALAAPLAAQEPQCTTISPAATSACNTAVDAVKAFHPLAGMIVSGGNPDGYISAEDAKEASPWYWSAPAKFLGDKSVAYGGELIFDLRQSRIDNPGQTTIDVILSGGGITLDFDESYNPGTQWTRYTIRLDVSAEWKITGSNQAATRADLARVLKSLEELKILGDYRVGKGNCDLDNVMLIGR